MSNEQAQVTLNEVLIERQGVRIGQMATQIEALTIQVEHLSNLLELNGIAPDGSRLEGESIRNTNGEEVAVV